MSLILPSNARGPILDLDPPTDEGACTIMLRNKTTGKSLAINLPADWDAGTLTLDWSRRRITDAAGLDRSALLDPGDNALWLDGQPFAAQVGNDVEVEAALVDPPFVGPLSPGSAADVKYPDPEPEDLAFVSPWANPGNALVSDDTYATGPEKFKSYTDYLVLGDFGAVLPVGAIPLGVVVLVERHRTSEHEVKDRLVTITTGDIPGAGDNKRSAALWDVGVDVVASYGSSSDLWGLPLGRADVESSDLSVVLQAEGGSEGLVDTASIVIYHSRPLTSAVEATLRWEKGYY